MDIHNHAYAMPHWPVVVCCAIITWFLGQLCLCCGLNLDTPVFVCVGEHWPGQPDHVVTLNSGTMHISIGFARTRVIICIRAFTKKHSVSVSPQQ
jgi:hypothetical protein